MFSYDGNIGVSTTMTWNNPAWSSGNDCNILIPYDCATYEHDLVINKNFFSGGIFNWCTSMSSLPGDYDDCPTAGILEPRDIVFSFGSARAHDIVPGMLYKGSWKFKGLGSSTQANAELMGQEGHFVHNPAQALSISNLHILPPVVYAAVNAVVCTTVNPPLLPDPRPWCIKADRTITLDTISIRHGVVYSGAKKAYPSTTQ